MTKFIGPKKRALLERIAAAASRTSVHTSGFRTAGLDQLNPYHDKPFGNKTWSKTVLRKNRWKKKPPLGPNGEYSPEQERTLKIIRLKRELHKARKKSAATPVTMPKLSI